MCQDHADNRAPREDAAAVQAREQSWNAEAINTHIAHALARGYMYLFYVNMDTGDYIEYSTGDALGVLTEARRGADFFGGCERYASQYVHSEDRPAFMKAMERAALPQALERSEVFDLTCRILKAGEPYYVNLRVSRMEDDPAFIVIAVSDVDELTRQRLAERRVQEERTIYARLHALTGNFICVYVVDPETGRYREFSATENYVDSFAQAKEGEDFFATVREAARQFNYTEEAAGDIQPDHRQPGRTVRHAVLHRHRYQHLRRDLLDR